MIEDAELLRRYARNHDDASFTEFVQRHVDLVHSAALRQTNGDTHLAQDVTQLVFADVARKAAKLAEHRVLAGWLFTSTRFAAAKLIRGERRRQAREQEAHTMDQLTPEPAPNLDWRRVRPVLDEAIAELNAADREAILLRYFEGRGFAEVGAHLGASENTARMRVERALDKLHGMLARRGVTSTSGALAVALANQAVVAAPAGLAATVAGAVLAGAGGGAVAAAGMAGGAAATVVGLGKLQLGLAGALLVVGAGGFVAQQVDEREAAQEVASLRAEGGAVLALQRDNLRLGRALAEAEHLRTAAVRTTQLQDELAALRRRHELATRERLAAARQPAPPATAAPIDVGKVDRLPQITGTVAPKYPQAMRDAGIAGEVVVRLIVDAQGKVKEAFPARSSRPEFEAAAVEAVRQWVFDPGVKGGRAVNTVMEQPISFTLDSGNGAVVADVGELVPVDNAEWF